MNAGANISPGLYRSLLIAILLMGALMIALARTLARAEEPALNLLFHSSEAIVGGSPYNRTAGELEAFLERLDRFFAFAIRDLGAVPSTFTEFRRAYAG